jgi:hypothetical protein
MGCWKNAITKNTIIREKDNKGEGGRMVVQPYVVNYGGLFGACF